MATADSGWKKTPGKFATSDKNTFSLSPSRRDPPTTYKSKLEIHVDDQKTSHKRSANFCKNEADFILKESQRRIEDALNRSGLHIENNQNTDKAANYVKSAKSEEIEFQANEHRIQIEKLLLEISRLHDVIYDLERMKKTENQKIREELEHITILQLNNIRQSHSSQLEILESTLKKTRDALAEKTEDYEQILKSSSKEKEMFKKQIEKLRNDLKEVVDKKNSEIYTIREENEGRVREMERNKNEAIEDMKEYCEREVKKMQRELEEREGRFERLAVDSEENEKKHIEFEEEILRDKEDLEIKLQNYIEQNHEKFRQLTLQINQNIEQSLQNSESRESLHRDIFETEIQNLLKIIKLKDQQNERAKTYYELQSLETKLIRKNYEDELQEMRHQLSINHQNSFKEMEQLKVRMAILHENDIKGLVQLYESKIEGLNKEIVKLGEDGVRLRKYMNEETHLWYEAKKKYENKISQLNVEILRVKSGMDELEKEMKDRLENERSAMLITSRQLIKGAQLKGTNSKFNEDEVRKLRQIIQKKEQQTENITSLYESKLSSSEGENKKLIQTVQSLKKEHQDLEHEYLSILEEKCEEIKKLNQITHDLMEENQESEGEEVKMLRMRVEEQENKLEEKSDTIRDLHIKIDKMEKDLNDVKVQNEHLYLENQINHEHAKGEYEKVSHKNMKSLKDFYERRMRELESDKDTLQRKLSTENENLCELIKRYQVLESGMRSMVTQSKKRTQLEQRLMNMGMDENLVKNKAQIFRGQ